MNVLYAGVENPVSISVSGISPEEIIPTISCGTLTYLPDYREWVARVPGSCQEARITVQARIDGQIRMMGSVAFRVKGLPEPRALIANRDQGLVSKEVLIAAGKLEVRFPDDFDFYYPYKITSFKLSLQRGFKDYEWVSESALLSPEMIEQLKRTNRGQKVVFSEIRASGPDQAVSELREFSLTIN